MEWTMNRIGVDNGRVGLFFRTSWAWMNIGGRGLISLAIHSYLYIPERGGTDDEVRSEEELLRPTRCYDV